LTRNANGAETVAVFDVTVIVPRTVVGFATFGAASRHEAAPADIWPAERFVVEPTRIVQRTVPDVIGWPVSTCRTCARTTTGLPALPVAGVTVGRPIESV
jgi:hypothetical protein